MEFPNTLDALAQLNINTTNLGAHNVQKLSNLLEMVRSREDRKDTKEIKEISEVRYSTILKYTN